jgi:hypothetical protein
MMRMRNCVWRIWWKMTACLKRIWGMHQLCNRTNIIRGDCRWLLLYYVCACYGVLVSHWLNTQKRRILDVSCHVVQHRISQWFDRI